MGALFLSRCPRCGAQEFNGMTTCGCCESKIKRIEDPNVIEGEFEVVFEEGKKHIDLLEFKDDTR